LENVVSKQVTTTAKSGLIADNQYGKIYGSSPAGPSRRQLFSGYLFFILALTCSPDVNAQRQKSYFVSSGLMINQIVVPEFAVEKMGFEPTTS
jgi:hypothetical protein